MVVERRRSLVFLCHQVHRRIVTPVTGIQKAQKIQNLLDMRHCCVLTLSGGSKLKKLMLKMALMKVPGRKMRPRKLIVRMAALSSDEDWAMVPVAMLSNWLFRWKVCFERLVVVLPLCLLVTY